MNTAINELVRIAPADVLDELKKHILVDGFEIVIDLERSQGSRLYDSHSNRSLIDMYAFYASLPVGFNHPYFQRPEVQEDLLAASMIKVANSDMYTVQMARFVKTFDQVMGIKGLPRLFFIEGGALAVENALKAAMDWKVQKNIAAGRGEIGTEVLHFKHAFHGRSGYTMSLTNTDPNKVKYYAKFDWPRVSSPAIDFSLPEPERTNKVIEAEKQAEAEILKTLADRPHRICSIILEPIQSEGGDRHFRKEWFQTLRRICDQHELLFIVDEVQTGMGITGKNWCYQHFDITPDLLCFGKKAQVCGVMGGARMDEVKENVFRKPSRINSTWGGNFTDMVRSTHFLTITEQEDLVDNVRVMGERLSAELKKLDREFPIVTSLRGRGLVQAFDMPTTEIRDKFWKGCFASGLLVLRSGERSIRLRPVMDLKPEIVDEAIYLMKDALRKLV